MAASKTLTKSARVMGADRLRLQREIAKLYQKGESIRAIAATHGRSFGWVHRMLVEADVPMRARGGNTRGGRRKAATRK